LFGGSGFTYNGEYQPHFVDLMLKGSWAQIHGDELCANGFPVPDAHLDEFGFEVGLSDYEDGIGVTDNDIGMWSHDPELFPRRFTNIDSTNPNAADKIMAEYQIDEAGLLDGREVVVSMTRGEETYLSFRTNYYMDPDAGCTPNSQGDMLFRRWVVAFEIPAAGISTRIDLYVNASQARRIWSRNCLNFLWENPGRANIENDRFKIIIFDPEVRLASSGEWVRAERFLVDWRTLPSELPEDGQGRFLGGFRKCVYRGRPALEASFGYGHADYVKDGDPTSFEANPATKGVIDLTIPSINSISMGSNGKLALSWRDCGPDALYEVQWTPSLLAPGWHTLRPTYQWPVVQTSWTGDVPSTSSACFLRLRTSWTNGLAP